MIWKNIENESDIEDLLRQYGHFHDSCLKELKYISGAYVNKSKGMYSANSKRNVSMIFQSQFSKNPVLEIEFGDVKLLNLNPNDEKYDCIILGASLVISNNLFYWADYEDFSISDIDHRRTWICSGKIKWRFIDGYLGDEVIYETK